MDPLSEYKYMQREMTKGALYAGLVGAAIGPLSVFGGYKLFQHTNKNKYRFGPGRIYASFLLTGALGLWGATTALAGIGTIYVWATQ